MNKPLISIIVPIYNVEKYLTRCLDSIINQTYKELEIILVDDGSPDHCGVIADQYALSDNRIKVIHKTNGGLSEARNSGVSVCNGSYVTFVDSDDFLSLEFISKMYNLCVVNNCSIAQCAFEKGFKEEFSDSNSKKCTLILKRENIFDTREVGITVWGKLYKKSVLINLSFPIAKINEDEFYTYKALYAAEQIIITREKLYYYFQSPNSITRSEKKYLPLDFIDAYVERIAFFKNIENEKQITISEKELSIRLMLTYISARSNINNTNDKLKLLADFKKHFLKIDKSYISIKERLILRLFNTMPNIIADFIKIYKGK